MNTEFQDINWAKPIIKQQLKTFPTSKISTIFKVLRNHPRFTLIGDYPIFSVIISEMKNMKINITKLMIRKALKYSEELKGRKTIVDNLFDS